MPFNSVIPTLELYSFIPYIFIEHLTMWQALFYAVEFILLIYSLKNLEIWGYLFYCHTVVHEEEALNLNQRI